MSTLNQILRLTSRLPGVGPFVNRVAINYFARSAPPRPRPFSLWSAAGAGDTLAPEYITDYTSWPGLTNRAFTARHLPPADPAYVNRLPKDSVYVPGLEPEMGEVTSLFARRGPMNPSRSSLLFMFFAQWFTDSVLRFDLSDRRRNTSNHDIDLCEVYGLSEEAARLLRTGKDGRLRSQAIDGEEYLEYLCEERTDGVTVRPHFEALLGGGPRTADEVVDLILAPNFRQRKAKLYATGLERGNNTIGYAAITTIFMREHNRLAAGLKQNHRTWSDERLFQTARNINIVLLLKLIVEDYINHIVGYPVFKLDHQFAEDENWYRPNWIALEFDLLYRWHGLAPDSILIDGRTVGQQDFRYNNALLESVGVGPLIDAVSRQPAGRIGLANTPSYLWAAESQAVKMSRDFRLRPYNDYRERFGLSRLRDFTELTTDSTLSARLAELYQGKIDDLEFLVGLFAEEASEEGLFGELMNRMVAYDAFTQIFTNPLLSRNVYGPGTFTDYGLEQIERTSSIEDLVNRNVSEDVRASLALIPSDA